jgi:glucosamine 6-phosphate synthetase-like amidotransferase/phosphosugar isomerase protein
MCGLCGVILGRKRRRRTALRQIAGLFTELLLDSQIRGTDAAGVAVVGRDGSYKLLKRPGPAGLLVEDKLYGRVVEFDNKVTAVLGHTRRKSRGSERNSLNNHPIRAGRVMGCHNGHLQNADDLVARHRLPRVAEVDSEVLFRLADRARGPRELKRLLAGCRGQMSAAFVRLDRPLEVCLLKGDKPLHADHVPRMRAVFYASEPWMLQTALQDLSHDPLQLDPFTLCTFDTRAVLDFTQTDVAFLSPELPRPR